jgi:hypothetical protein
MDTKPDLPRLRDLCLLGFKLGDTVLYCPDCMWQAFEHQGMRPVCPDCGANLHYAKVDPELVELADPMNRLYRAIKDHTFAAPRLVDYQLVEHIHSIGERLPVASWVGKPGHMKLIEGEQTGGSTIARVEVSQELLDLMHQEPEP